MIKAIICDTDGMLVHSDPFTVELERKYGISQEITRPFFLGPFQNCLTGKTDTKEAISPFLTSWGWEKSIDDYFNEWFVFENKVDEQLIDYLLELRKKGIKMLLITNQEKYRTKYLLEEMKFSNIFDTVLSSADVGYKKPDPEIFSAAYSKISELDKKEIIFWDDQEKNVNSAKTFGFRAEVYTSLANFKQKTGVLIK